MGILLFMDVTPLPHFIDLQGCGGGCCFFKSQRCILDVACMYATELGSLKITFDFIITMTMGGGCIDIDIHNYIYIWNINLPLKQPSTFAFASACLMQNIYLYLYLALNSPCLMQVSNCIKQVETNLPLLMIIQMTHRPKPWAEAICDQRQERL